MDSSEPPRAPGHEPLGDRPLGHEPSSARSEGGGGPGEKDPGRPLDPGAHLDAYVRKTQDALDALALVTLPLVVVPPDRFGVSGGIQGLVLGARILLSVIYAGDLAMRAHLAPSGARYALRHPLIVASVLVPPVRLVFSLRFLRSMFRRGSLHRYLVAEALVLIDGAVIVYLFEHNAPGATIRTIGEAFWWVLVTVTTVGYGDYTPVTVVGRITAVVVMGTGVVTLAVVTAQLASTFVVQSASRKGPEPGHGADQGQGATLADLAARLARIEAALSVLAAPSALAEPDPPAPGQDPGP